MDILGIVFFWGVVAPIAYVVGGVWRTLKWLLGRG